MNQPITNPLLLSIDAGTESLRVGLFDIHGHLLTQSACSYPTAFPQPSWAEQDPRDWHHALITALRDCLQSTTENINNIAGICFDATTCTLLLLDHTLQPLRPPLLWMDVRAAEQAQHIHSTMQMVNHPALQYSPNGLAAEWMLAKMLWLRQHEPELYTHTAHIIEFTDWIAYTLTGHIALNQDTTTQRWHYNARTWRWPTDLFDGLGLPDLRQKFPQDVLPLGAALGGLRREIANAIGQPTLAGVPVFEGGGDAFVALLGMNVAQPGRIGLITGSSNVICGFFDQPLHAPGLLGAFPDAIVPGLHLLEAGQVSTGSILSWFKQNFARELAPSEAYRVLDQEAAQVAMGAGGIIALDHFQGNRTPYTDSRSRGALWGLTLSSTRGHLFRALMEGIVYGTRQILEIMQAAGGPQQLIYACGGATRSPIFMQLYADICGLPIAVLRVPDAPLLGGAIAAATGAGIYANLIEAAAAMTEVATTYHPNMAEHARSNPFFERYKATYPSLRPLLHQS